jgi:tRNA-uridine 2-sulfurtransferase
MTAIRALGLLSGGLDSALAARILLDQGVEVVGLHLESPMACRSDVHAVAGELGIPLEVRKKGEEYLRLLRHPRWGHGRHMNPCIDCRHYMFQIASSLMDELGTSFLFTGEVLNQRPMSQTRSSLQLIDRAAGLERKILRPLSAKLLDETEPEQRGWVDRSKLFAIAGRSRHLQLALAERWQLTAHQSPGGGCLLTDAHFSAKLRDLFDHRAEERTTMDDVAMLKLGRHYRIGAEHKVVLGRDAQENAKLARLENDERWLIEPVGLSAPAALVCGPRSEEALAAALQLIAAHARNLPAGALARWKEGNLWLYREMPQAAQAPDVLATAVRAAPAGAR